MMEKKNNFFEKLMKEIENPDSEFNKSFKKELELRESWRKRNGRFIDSLGPEGRYKAFKKIREKYESDEYVRSEYSKGYEPRCPLFGVILDYAEDYGEALDPDVDFCAAKFHIDNTWVIRLFVGQGSFEHLDLISEDRHNERFWKDSDGKVYAIPVHEKQPEGMTEITAKEYKRCWLNSI